MILSEFTALSITSQVSHLKGLNHSSAPMWLCNFSDAYFKFKLGGLIGFPEPYIKAWHSLNAFRLEQMKMSSTELDLVWSGGSSSGRRIAKCYPANSYTHS